MNGSARIPMKDVRRYRNQPPPVSNRQFLLTSRVDLPSTSSSAAVDNVPDGLTRVSPIQKSSLNTPTRAKRDTVVTCEANGDAAPSNTCCCGKMKLQVGCRIVGISSLLAIISNATLYFFGIPRLGLSGTIEVMLLVVDFFTVFFLFLGLSKHRAGLMKPYMFFNSIWTLCLCLLLVICLWKIIKGSDLPNNILSNLHNLNSPTIIHDHQSDHHHPQMRQPLQASSGVSFLVTAAVMLSLVAIIIVDGFFVHIVYRTFSLFAYLEDKAKEDAGNQQTTTSL